MVELRREGSLQQRLRRTLKPDNTWADCGTWKNQKGGMSGAGWDTSRSCWNAARAPHVTRVAGSVLTTRVDPSGTRQDNTEGSCTSSIYSVGEAPVAAIGGHSRTCHCQKETSSSCMVNESSDQSQDSEMHRLKDLEEEWESSIMSRRCTLKRRVSVTQQESSAQCFYVILRIDALFLQYLYS